MLKALRYPDVHLLRSERWVLGVVGVPVTAAAILCTIASGAAGEPIRFVGVHHSQTGTVQFRRSTDNHGWAFQILVDWEYDITIDGASISFERWRVAGARTISDAFQNLSAELSLAFEGSAAGTRSLLSVGDDLYDIQPYSLTGDLIITYRDEDEDKTFTVSVEPYSSTSTMKQRLDMTNFPQTAILAKTDSNQSPVLLRPASSPVINTNYGLYVMHFTRPDDPAILMSSFVNGSDVDADRDIDGNDFL